MFAVEGMEGFKMKILQLSHILYNNYIVATGWQYKRCQWRKSNLLFYYQTAAATTKSCATLSANFDSCVYQPISCIQIAIRNLHRGKQILSKIPAHSHFISVQQAIMKPISYELSGLGCASLQFHIPMHLTKCQLAVSLFLKKKHEKLSTSKPFIIGIMF